jgi:hypothetical protein
MSAAQQRRAHADDAVPAHASDDRRTATSDDRRDTDALDERGTGTSDGPNLIPSCWRHDCDAAQAAVDVDAHLRSFARSTAADPRRDIIRRDLARQTIDELKRAAPPRSVRVVPELISAIVHPMDRRRSPLRLTGMVVGAVGAVGLIASGRVAARAQSIQGDLELLDRPRRDSRQAAGYRGGQRPARTALIIGVSGVVLTASGVTLYYIGRHADRELRISASGGVDRGELVVSGRF